MQSAALESRPAQVRSSALFMGCFSPKPFESMLLRERRHPSTATIWAPSCHALCSDPEDMMGASHPAPPKAKFRGEETTRSSRLGSEEVAAATPIPLACCCC